MEEKIIDLDKFVQEKLEMLKVEKGIIENVKQEYLIKLLRLIGIESVGLALILMNDNNFGKLMMLPTIVFGIPLFDMAHNTYIKYRDIKKIEKEINKLNTRQY